MLPSKVDIGLQYRIPKQKLARPGYARLQTNSNDGSPLWQYSKKAQAEIEKYVARFPALFQRLLSLGGVDELQVASLFPEATTPAEQAAALAEVQLFLKELPSRAIPLGNAGMSMSLESIKTLQQLLQRNPASEGQQGEGGESSSTPTTVDVDLRPVDVMKPDMDVFVAPKTVSSIDLGDRVVFSRIGSAVPFGARGFVIASAASGGSGGIGGDDSKENKWEVVFDEPFLGGSTLGKKCAAYTGFLCSASSLFNLSGALNVVRVSKGEVHPRLAPAALRQLEVTTEPTAVRGGGRGRGGSRGRGATDGGRGRGFARGRGVTMAEQPTPTPNQQPLAPNVSHFFTQAKAAKQGAVQPAQASSHSASSSHATNATNATTATNATNASVPEGSAKAQMMSMLAKAMAGAEVKE